MEFDFYLNYSTGQVLGDRDPGNYLFDALFCPLSLHDETMES